jgi:plasmid maintenance system antidote protein VapI
MPKLTYKNPSKVAKTLARRINTGNIIGKYGTKTVKTLHGVSLGIVGFSLAKKINGITLPTIGMAGVTAALPLYYLAKALPKKLEGKTIERLIGKPRLAALTAKKVSDSSSKAFLYLIANARTKEEQQTIRLALQGEKTDMVVLTELAKRATQKQGDELSKKLFLELRAQRGIKIKHLDYASERISELVRSRKITTDEAYQLELKEKAFPLALSNTMDLFKIHDNTLRQRIFNALKNQSKRLQQKQAVNPNIKFQDLLQDIMIQQHVEELGTTLNLAFKDKRTAKSFIQKFTRINALISRQIHYEVQAKLYWNNLMKH